MMERPDSNKILYLLAAVALVVTLIGGFTGILKRNFDLAVTNNAHSLGRPIQDLSPARDFKELRPHVIQDHESQGASNPPPATIPSARIPDKQD
jgi:hypothetical protein